MNDFATGSSEESSPSVPARLTVERGPTPQQQFLLSAASSTIGRSPSNDVVIDDPEASRRHAQLLRQRDGYAVEDLGSTNGTFVNGERCDGVTPLYDGDVIELGDTISLIFSHEVGAPAARHVYEDEDTGDLPPLPQPPTAAPQAPPPHCRPRA